jgi:hypothetical protein
VSSIIGGRSDSDVLLAGLHGIEHDRKKRQNPPTVTLASFYTLVISILYVVTGNKVLYREAKIE